MLQRWAAWSVGAVAIALLAIMGWITYIQLLTLSEATGWVTHSERVRLTLERSLAILADAEAGVRTYLLMRDETLLGPYRNAQPALEENARALRALVADNPSQTISAAELDRLAQNKVARMRTLLEAAASGALDPRWLEGALRDGTARMNAVRALIQRMQVVETSLLEKRLKRADRARLTALGATSAFVVLAIGLVLLTLLANQRAAKQLRQSEQWLATTLTSIGDGVIATDARGYIRFCNPVAEALTGWPLAEARGKPLEEIFRIANEDTGAAVESPVAQVLRSGSIVGMANHTVLLRRDGSSIPIEDSGAPIRTEGSGSLQGVVLVFRDASQARAAAATLRANVEERERALRNLAETEERLRLATEGAEIGTWDVDLPRDVAIWNSRMYELTGVAPGTPLTRELRRANIAPEDMPLVERAIDEARRERKPFHVEYRLRRTSDSMVRWMSSHGRFFYDEAGNPVRRAGTLQDITERRQLEERLRQAQKLDALGTLAGGIAHDFNNILSLLRGSLLVAESELTPEHPAWPAFAEMNRAWVRARDLVRQILTFGRRQEQDRRLLALEPVIADALKLLRATLPAAVEIQFQAAKDLPNVLGDASQIHQIIMNLGINASHAIGNKPGLIRVDLDRATIAPGAALTTTELTPGQYVCVRFADSGAGMTAEVREHIFEPFFTTKPVGVGTGLGLSVVRGIMKNHDGTITVYSQPDKGTQFHLYFPAMSGEAEAVAPAAAPAPGSGERILYLDDEAALVVLGKHLLERLGYTVQGFTDAAEALVAFRAAPQSFDLVLTDLSMPGTSGLDVARSMLELRPDIPILLASGYIRAEDADEARRIGIREIVWKPFTVNEIGEVIARVLKDGAAP